VNAPLDLGAAAAGLLALGREGTHPAGAVVGVRTAGGTALAADGWARLPSGDSPGTRMRADTLLDLASVTKTASTTTMIMRLVAAGRLDVDAPVAETLPGFRGDGKAGVTTALLLSHRAGLVPWWPLYCETTGRDEALDLVERMALATAPDTEWRYSDLGLMLSGRIVERVTGLSLARAFRELVADPLGLRHTGFGPVDPESAATAGDSDVVEFTMIATGQPFDVPFSPADFAGWRTRAFSGAVNDGNTAHALGGASGHAGLFAPVEELLAIGAAALDESFVPREVLERFAAPNASTPSQALGFRRVDAVLGTGAAAEVVPMIAHNGFTGTFLGTALDRDLTIGGGATRLHGTTGPITDAAARTAAVGSPDLVTGDEIRDALLRGAGDALLAAGALPPPASTRSTTRATATGPEVQR
jgi:CubicO group peptidase (beta-lactamase class C family)